MRAISTLRAALCINMTELQTCIDACETAFTQLHNVFEQLHGVAEYDYSITMPPHHCASAFHRFHKFILVWDMTMLFPAWAFRLNKYTPFIPELCESPRVCSFVVLQLHTVWLNATRIVNAATAGPVAAPQITECLNSMQRLLDLPECNTDSGDISTPPHAWDQLAEPAVCTLLQYYGRTR